MPHFLQLNVHHEPSHLATTEWFDFARGMTFGNGRIMDYSLAASVVDIESKNVWLIRVSRESGDYSMNLHFKLFCSFYFNIQLLNAFETDRKITNMKIFNCSCGKILPYNNQLYSMDQNKCESKKCIRQRKQDSTNILQPWKYMHFHAIWPRISYVALYSCSANDSARPVDCIGREYYSWLLTF